MGALARILSGGLDPATAPPAELRFRRNLGVVGLAGVVLGLLVLAVNPLVGAADDNPFVAAYLATLLVTLWVHGRGWAPRLVFHALLSSTWAVTFVAAWDKGLATNAWSFLALVPIAAAFTDRGRGVWVWGGVSLISVLALGWPMEEVEITVEALLVIFSVTCLVAAVSKTQRWLAQRLEGVVVELERENRERRAAEDAAREAARAKADFLATMSHEIRTPLHGVIGAAQLLGSSPLDREQRELLATLDTSAELLLALIDDVLHLSRIEARGVVLEAVPVQLERHLREVTAPQARIAEAKGLEFAYRVSPECPRWLRQDPTRLGQVVLNLVGNALKFTERGAVTLRVEPRGERLLVEVEDTGIGIEPAALERLFRPFTQADGTIARRFGGTGLGLSIVREIVKAMGGQVEVRSTPGRGSTFSVEIPLTPCEPPQVLLPERDRGERPAPATKRVLVADDNEVNRKILSRMLGQLGAEVTTSEDGVQALARLEEGAFDLVLMDVQMPELDGLEATRRIRSGGRHPGLRVGGLSAGVQESERAEALGAGMDDYLTKPVRLAELRDALTRWG